MVELREVEAERVQDRCPEDDQQADDRVLRVSSALTGRLRPPDLCSASADTVFTALTHSQTSRRPFKSTHDDVISGTLRHIGPIQPQGQGHVLGLIGYG